MLTLREGFYEERGLKNFFGPNIGYKVMTIGKTRESVKLLLKNYLCNGYYVAEMGAKEKVDEFNAVCEILTSKTTQEILAILGDDIPEKFSGTNENRKYLLEKLGLDQYVKH